MKTINQLALQVGALSFACSLFAQSSAVQTWPIPDSADPVLAQSTLLGASNPAEVVHFTLGLQPRYPAELQAFCDSVSNPLSPNYRQFMTPQQVGESFGASPTDVGNVVAYLKSQGLKVDLVAPSRMAILVHGTVGQIQSAFSTKIKNYAGPDPSGTKISFRANSTPLLVPATIAPVITCISGIDNYSRPKAMTTLTPGLARGLYNTAPSYAAGAQGQGRRIAISNWDGYRISNAATYISNYGLPIPAGGSTSNIHIVSVAGANNSAAATHVEGDLDIQMELAAAPLADIYIYDGSQTSSDLIATLTLESTDNIADIISESYGWRLSAATKLAAHNLHLTMTAQGQTYLCASGDSGTSGLNPPTGNTNYYPYPDIDPEVLTVGGTIATVNTSTGARVSETAWSGGGGGWATASDTFNVLPGWQTGNGVPTGNNHRLVPDIGMHSASSGNAFFLIYNGSLSSVSGTSCASPYCASSLSTLEQRLASLGLLSRFGRINDLIYSENGRSDIWFDVTSGSNGTLPDGTTSSAHAGWDFASGWGAPNFDAWYTALSTRNVSGTVTLQNFVGAVAGTPITVQLYQAGTSTLVDTKTTTLDASGNFTISSQAPGGNYDIYVKASHWLRRKVANQSFMLAGASGLAFSLINGDVNGDNAVTLGDFATLRAAYGSSSGSGNWNANADLDGGGNVGLGDFAILRGNYGLSGD